MLKWVCSYQDQRTEQNIQAKSNPKKNRRTTTNWRTTTNEKIKENGRTREKKTKITYLEIGEQENSGLGA